MQFKKRLHFPPKQQTANCISLPCIPNRMASSISLHSLSSALAISVFLLFFFTPPRPSLSHPLLSNRCPSRESRALLRFKAGLNDSSGSSLSSWVNGSDCCTEWRGISCDNLTNHVVSVEAFDVGYLDTQGVISESLCQLPFLTSLKIWGASGTTIPPCLGNLSHMQSLVLFYNSLSGMIPPSLCLLTRLTLLYLDNNNLNGIIPSCLGNLASLTELDLSYNNLGGSIPASLVNLSVLRDLHFEYNQLSGNIPDSLGNLSLLRHLSIDNNQLSGTIPSSFSRLSSLTELTADGNRFNETISSSSLPPLDSLSLSLNHHQSVSETFFHNLTSLNHLYLSDCVLNISTTWIPPFQLHELYMVSCMTDGEFPPWISTQFSLETLELSNISLVGVIPSWVWVTSPVLEFLNLSGNHLEGSLFSITSIGLHLDQLDLSRNGLSGCIPSIWPSTITVLHLNDNLFSGNIPPSLGGLSNLTDLYLSNNLFTGNIPPSLDNLSQLWELNLANNLFTGNIPPSLGNFSQLRLLNLANNLFTGNIPPSLGNLSLLRLLNLANNLFTGNIPPSLGNLSQLQLLNLANNNITGVIPVSLSNCSSLVALNLRNNSLEGSLPHEFSKLSELSSLVVHSNKLDGSFPPLLGNCSKLQVLDIGNNLFGGEISDLVINLSNLRVLVMEDNKFIGNIPSNIGQLRKLNILQLSSNHMSGLIPHTIISLQAMENESQDGYRVSDYGIYYKDGLDMTSKGINEHYTYILSTLTSIDLSNNYFEGGISPNFGNLKGLRFLNLSMNNLNGTIPSSFGDMSQLESLDLSRNKFLGHIPMEFDSLNSLSFLNLSNNNLSGRIPQGPHMTTFEASSFVGNPFLSGCPLPKNCSRPRFVLPPAIPISKRKRSTKHPWYGIAIGLSYGIAFGVIVTLIVTKISWRRIYFNRVDTILKFLFPWMKNLTL